MRRQSEKLTPLCWDRVRRHSHKKSCASRLRRHCYQPNSCSRRAWVRKISGAVLGDTSPCREFESVARITSFLYNVAAAWSWVSQTNVNETETKLVRVVTFTQTCTRQLRQWLAFHRSSQWYLMIWMFTEPDICCNIVPESWERGCVYHCNKRSLCKHNRRLWHRLQRSIHMDVTHIIW